ncbi:MAG: hypothetical protein BMS9Abin02_0725 [Anaerolineae bacterium]|nr:MAG: hypothetical protein BMS9Abin02_0725 [Anaerolineae bacterium]
MIVSSRLKWYGAGSLGDDILMHYLTMPQLKWYTVLNSIQPSPLRRQ